jgi:hypothetical protein
MLVVWSVGLRLSRTGVVAMCPMWWAKLTDAVRWPRPKATLDKIVAPQSGV